MNPSSLIGILFYFIFVNKTIPFVFIFVNKTIPFVAYL